ncbi:MAG: DEAD/DEAH box helicase [Methylotenera sp.]|uniref:DEAD/DEAH box helicase n=1 Tax=Methylotenera sp. TaxID=2051956 RepID=UPI0018487E38|nr:DEAD/DEAH box helicase [Methylotenera sp.]NOU25723.1 DEAD/DEAH box helicase [Methylotenera sp.]
MTTETTLNFNELGLAEPILRAINDAGYTTPTPIQAKAIPQVLSGGDLLAGAQTGTGKTAGFTLPILHLLSQKPAENLSKGRPRCLMLTPTRELAAQIEESVKTYGKYLPLTSTVIFGGVNANPQIARLKKPLDILVATPGRLLDHANQKNVDLSGVEILVLDEADRMLDMGFIRDIKKILAMLPKQRQNLLFSATFSDEIKALADGLLHNPGFVEVARRNTASELVEQTVHMVAQGHKRQLMSHLIQQNDWKQVLIFTRTKHGANRLAEKLVKDGIQSAAIHGNKSQGARTKALAQFKDGSMRVLVATDIAARGLDIDQLPQVVNFELPNVPEDYVHRIGRTGRAGSSGAAVSLVDREELKLLKDIEKLIKREIPKVQVEGFTPSDKPEPEAPRSTQAHGRPPRGHGQGQQRKAHVQSASENNGSNPSAGRNQNRNNGQRNGQAQGRSPAGLSAEGRPLQNSPKPTQGQNTKNLSEAARHQAMPQTSLFVPPSPNRRPPNRPNETRGTGRTNTNPNSTHRSGGRGR